MLKYKIDVISALKSANFSTYRIRKEHLFSEGTLQRFRNGEIVDNSTIDNLCSMLQLQPGDILEFVPDDEQ